jgi:predicted NAD/FAD-dependent oxidoreductase
MKLCCKASSPRIGCLKEICMADCLQAWETIRNSLTRPRCLVNVLAPHALGWKACSSRSPSRSKPCRTTMVRRPRASWSSQNYKTNSWTAAIGTVQSLPEFQTWTRCKWPMQSSCPTCVLEEGQQLIFSHCPRIPRSQNKPPSS